MIISPGFELSVWSLWGSAADQFASWTDHGAPFSFFQGPLSPVTGNMTEPLVLSSHGDAA
jgi:hypothetical protein